MNLDNYTKEKCIGKGGFGIVYLCTDLKGNKCVIKEVFTAGMKETDVEKTCKEASILSSLKHPHIIKYISHICKNKILYIAMEYAPGGNLENYLDTLEKNLSEEEVLDILSQLMTALAYIHREGIVHKDLNAKNILIGQDDVLKLSDFGISRGVESSSSGNIGNPGNFAPELCWGGRASPASDIWAVGCLLFQLKTRQPPFSAPSLAGLIRLIVDRPRPSLPADTSPALAQLLADLLRHRPEDRPSACRLLAHPLLARRPILLPGKLFRRLQGDLQGILKELQSEMLGNNPE